MSLICVSSPVQSIRLWPTCTFFYFLLKMYFSSVVQAGFADEKALWYGINANMRGTLPQTAHCILNPKRMISGFFWGRCDYREIIRCQKGWRGEKTWQKARVEGKVPKRAREDEESIYHWRKWCGEENVSVSQNQDFGIISGGGVCWYKHTLYQQFQYLSIYLEAKIT